jgi:hypothetical protein
LPDLLRGFHAQEICNPVFGVADAAGRGVVSARAFAPAAFRGGTSDEAPMSVSSLSAAQSPIPISLLSQPNNVAADDFSADDSEDGATTANGLTGSTTVSLSNQTLQTLLGLQQDSSTQNTQATQTPPKAHHHGHGHGGGGGSSDTLENILAAADDSSSTTAGASTTSTTAGAPSDPLDPDAQNQQSSQAPL